MRIAYYEIGSFINRFRDDSEMHLASMARYEATFGNDLAHVWDQSVRKEAGEYAAEFRREAPQTNINANLAGVWRTTSMVTLENEWMHYGQIHGIDSISAPEPIAAIFQEVFGPNLGLSAPLLFTPTQKFSFDPPQLHTMPDLPAEEWYNFDWIGVIDGIIEHKNMIGLGQGLRISDQVRMYEELKDRLKEILPESPSPKNTAEAFFWEELKSTGMTPQQYYDLAVTWEHSKREAELYKSLGVDYHKALAEGNLELLGEVCYQNGEAFRKLAEHSVALRELGRGIHWRDREINPEGVTASYYNAVTAIKQDPDYEKAFDESIPYEERESIRMMLDKRMREMIDAGWQKFLLELQQSVLMKEPLRAALAASA